jgi:uncharacterized protein YbjT (DUF2867 family)
MNSKILVIGGSGFVGSELCKLLLIQNEYIRVLTRNPQKITQQSEFLEVVTGDLEDPNSLKGVFDGIEVIYYLAHGMKDHGQDFELVESQQVKNILPMITKNQRIIYLSGIIPDDELSPHLSSRKKVGELLSNSKADYNEIRASIIIGAGSESFELIRSLVHRAPCILSSSWAQAKCQPIALSDVVKYLIKTMQLNFDQTLPIIEIGGSEQMTYQDLITKIAKFYQLKRPVLLSEKFTKKMAMEAIKVIAPEYANTGIKLLSSIEHETIVHQFAPPEDIYQITPIKIEEYLKLIPVHELKKRKASDQNQQFLTQKLIGGDLFQIEIHSNQFDSLKELYQYLETFKNKVPVLNNIQLNLPSKEISLNIPFTGEFLITYSEEKEYLKLTVKPKYFFQSLGWTVLKHLEKFFYQHL